MKFENFSQQVIVQVNEEVSARKLGKAPKALSVANDNNLNES
jgi:hypothetical protein